MERGGRVIAKPFDKRDLCHAGLRKFIARFVDVNGSMLMTDEYRGYASMNTLMTHASVNHAIRYADGLVHTNCIEGFWSLVKRAWYGSHHHYSVKYMRLYIAEACFKYNQRKTPVSLDGALALMVGA